MSRWYAVDGVLILKVTVWPALTLIDVAKPWIAGSPALVLIQKSRNLPPVFIKLLKNPLDRIPAKGAPNWR